MKELTKSEEQIMQVIWKLDKAFIKDIIDELDEPKPAYTTIATLIKIMEKKGFVSHKKYGNTYQYYPLISKNEYSKSFLRSFVKKYFNNSFEKMVSFLAKSDDLSVSEIDKLIQDMQELKSKNNKNG